MEKFNHLAAHVREIMVLSDDERINFLYMDRWIGYQRAITVLNMLTDLLNRPKKLRPGEFKHEVRQFQKPYDNQQAEQISLMV